MEDVTRDDESLQHERAEKADSSPTTTRELRGWYSTGLAAEIFAVCGVGSFAPVTLEQLARENGVLRSDRATPCVQRAAAASSPSITRNVLNGSNSIVPSIFSRAEDKGQCVVFLLGRETTTASFAMYTFSLAVFIQALVLVSFSAVADYGTYRKRMMFGFAFSGAVASMAMIFVLPSIYPLASLLVVIGVVCLGSTFVLLNSFLPRLAANHPDAINHSDEDHEMTKSGKSSAVLAISTQISSQGVGIGYAAAVSVQILSIGLLILLKKAQFSSESVPLRSVLFMVGLFWLLLSIPGALWLRNRPGPTLRLSSSWRSRLPRFLQYLFFAWSSLWSTILIVTKLRQTLFFLLAWFLLSDAISTVSGTAILFARTELHMGTISVALLSITATTSGIAGAFFWPRIASYYRFSTKTTIIACMLLMEIIPLYGLLGFLPFVQKWGVGGLQRPFEIFPLGFVHGFVMGGLSSYCRALYGEMIPPGSEAAFYALYAITDKGSSAIGPSIVGLIIDGIGTIRPAFGFLAVLIALPIPLMYLIDVEKARLEARMLAKKGLVDSRVDDVDLDHVGGQMNEAAVRLLDNDQEANASLDARHVS